jgi:hypothetical protein
MRPPRDRRMLRDGASKTPLLEPAPVIGGIVVPVLRAGLSLIGQQPHLLERLTQLRRCGIETVPQIVNCAVLIGNPQLNCFGLMVSYRPSVPQRRIEFSDFCDRRHPRRSAAAVGRELCHAPHDAGAERLHT